MNFIVVAIMRGYRISMRFLSDGSVLLTLEPPWSVMLMCVQSQYLPEVPTNIHGLSNMAEWVPRIYSKGEIDRAAATLVPWWKGEGKDEVFRS